MVDISLIVSRDTWDPLSLRGVMLDPALSVSFGGPWRHAFGVTVAGPVSTVGEAFGLTDLVNTTVGGRRRGPGR